MLYIKYNFFFTKLIEKAKNCFRLSSEQTNHKSKMGITAMCNIEIGYTMKVVRFLSESTMF